jgi:arylsulfatase
LINGNAAGEGRIGRTERLFFSDDETFDVGMDTGTPVIETYQVPFVLNGKLEQLEIELEKPVTTRVQATSTVEQ